MQRLIDTTPFSIDKLVIPDGTGSYMRGYYYGAKHVLDEMAVAPTVDAVPMDKLCALLAQNADCPPEHSPLQDNCKENCAECWKSVLKEWMEEQDGTDNP